MSGGEADGRAGPQAGLDEIGAGLGARLRQLTAAMERFDAFVSVPGPPATAPAPATGESRGSAARALVLRALRAASDPQGWQIMERLARSDAGTGELAALLGCPRLIAWEQVNDLVQTGLAARSGDGDLTGLTPAGRGLAALVETLTAAAVAGGTGR